MIVNKKPRLVCTVTMVPTSQGSLSSITLAENCAESATTVMPQMENNSTTSHGAPPKANPTSRAQVPLMPIAPMVRVVRPTRSAKNPPARQPAAPSPIVVKVTSLALRAAPDPPGLMAKLALRYSPAHARKR